MPFLGPELFLETPIWNFLNQTSSTENVGEKPPGFFFALRHPCRLAVTVRRIRDDTSEVLEHFGRKQRVKTLFILMKGTPFLTFKIHWFSSVQKWAQYIIYIIHIIIDNIYIFM